MEYIFVTGSKFWNPNESFFKQLEMNTEKNSKFEGFFFFFSLIVQRDKL